MKNIENPYSSLFNIETKEEIELGEKWKDQVGDKPDNPNSVDWSEVDKLINTKRERKAPEGAFSISDLMEKYKIGEKKARKLIKLWLGDNKIVVVGVVGKKYYKVIG